jgi:hypothetical protein
LYGCKTWSLTLKKEHRLRLFWNRVLRRIFELKRDDVTGAGKKFHNVEHHNLYSSLSMNRMNKSSRMRCAGHVACMRDIRNTYKVLVGKPERKRPLRRHRHR